MYVEDQLWIADALEVELPDFYLIFLDKYPFLDHENTCDLALWDNSEEIINTTKALRKEDNWPGSWVCIGKRDSSYYALDCELSKIYLIKKGSNEKVDTYIHLDPLIDQIHDGYRGKLPYGWVKKDSTFKKIDYRKDIPWKQHYDRSPSHPLLDDIVLRIDENDLHEFISILKKKKVVVFRVNGKGITSREEFLDAISIGITNVTGCIDDWIDIDKMLTSQLEDIAKGGLLDAVVIWEHADITLKEQPNLMSEFMIYMHTDWQYYFEETGYFVNVLYTGKQENGFIVRLEKS